MYRKHDNSREILPFEPCLDFPTHCHGADEAKIGVRSKPKPLGGLFASQDCPELCVEIALLPKLG
jgi:hypothetical protein